MHRFLHRPGGELAGDGAADLCSGDQSGIREHVEMLHDRRQRHRERPGELAHRQAVLVVQPRDQRPPRRVGERREGAVEGLLMLNHRVKC
jgi:hypothetical protein